MVDLTGKVVLVTGGGSGLGRAIVARFIRAGAKLGVLERSTKLIESLEQEFGEDLCITCGDVQAAADNQRAVDAIVDRFGRLDVFIGNAGIYDNRAKLTDFSFEDLSAGFDELYSINVKGYMLGALAAVPELQKSRGSIIFTASVSSLQPGFGGVLYVSAKHAIAGLTKQLALELAPSIRVNAIAPGYIPTRLRGIEFLSQGESVSSPKAEQMPLEMIPDVDDYVAFYLLLASDQGCVTTTGSILLADGGLSLKGLKNS